MSVPAREVDRRVKLSLLYLPLRPDQLLELIPAELREHPFPDRPGS